MNAATQAMDTGMTPSGHTSAIRAKKVIGTNVHNTAGEKIGTIEDIVLDKLSNNIVFAVCGFGGFLGMGEKFHPVPWSALKYDERQGSYVVNLTSEQLRSAPADSISELARNGGMDFRDRTYAYYNEPKYW